MTRALLVCAMVLVAAWPLAAQRPTLPACDSPLRASGTYLDISIDIPGARFITLTALNARGDIVGRFSDERAVMRSFLLRRGRVTEIAVAGALWTLAADVNASGVVVGSYGTEDRQRAFTWHNGLFTLPPRPPTAWYLQFDAINASGAIAGSYGYQLDPGTFGGQAFVRRGSRMERIDVGRPWGLPVGINERGDVLLETYVHPGPGRGEYMVATRHGVQQVVGCRHLNGFTGLLHAITNQGSLVGREGPYGEYVGIVYSARGVTTYAYPGATSTELVDMNSSGMAIGHAFHGADTRPFLFVPH